MIVNCPHCNQQVDAPPNNPRPMRCPHCANVFQSSETQSTAATQSVAPKPRKQTASNPFTLDEIADERPPKRRKASSRSRDDDDDDERDSHPRQRERRPPSRGPSDSMSSLMVALGLILMGLGALIVLYSVGMRTAVSDTYNIGLLTEKIFWGMAGAGSAITGSVLFAGGLVVQSINRRGA